MWLLILCLAQLLASPICYHTVRSWLCYAAWPGLNSWPASPCSDWSDLSLDSGTWRHWTWAWWRPRFAWWWVSWVCSEWPICSGRTSSGVGSWRGVSSLGPVNSSQSLVQFQWNSSMSKACKWIVSFKAEYKSWRTQRCNSHLVQGNELGADL